MATRLRRSDCRDEGISRRRAGRGFSYLDADGERIGDDETMDRIHELAIPPAWKEVWICPDPLGHLQATGIDAAGRKQYLYHERWQQRQAERKFESVRRFAATLPRLRRAVTADLRRKGMRRERALACAVRLLDLGFFRVGGEVYAEENESFGLATVRRDHVTIADGEVVFDFPAKSGQRRVQSIRDPAARRAIETMRRRRSGPDDLLAWRDRREWRDVRSEDVKLAGEPEPASEAAAKRAISVAVERVADALGNTPAVCRRSYIDPRLIERFREGATISRSAPVNGRISARARAKLEREVRRIVS